VQLHHAGIAAEAQKLCELILQDRPDHFGALHLLGVSKTATRQFEQAQALLRRAVEADPRSAEAWCNLG
jgi:Flp pilus assembly protein TadD